MMMNRYFTYNRIEIPRIQSRIRIEYFSFEQRTMNKEKAKELEENKSRTKDEQNSMKIKQQ
jgi:hypothetical protein